MADVGTVGPEIPREVVLAELERVLSSESFVNASRLGAFLGHVVREALDGNADNLKEYQLGVDVFGRQESYDTRNDPVVRVGARQLRFKLGEYYRDFGQSDPVIISLPKGRYVPHFELRETLAVSTPVADPVSESAIPAAPEIPVRRPLHLRAALAVSVIALAAAGALASRYRLAPAAASPSVAILPFKNLSPDPSNQYFAEGLAEELTNELAHIPGLRVLARSSVNAVAQKTSDIREIGRQLGITDVVEGSIQRSGDRVIIVAHVERVSDGALVWSNRFDRQTSDLLKVQTEIASGIANSLNAARLPAPTHMGNQKAQEAVWKGEFELAVGADLDSLNRAEAEFRRAIEIDPGYGAAYGMLGIVKYNRAMFTDSHNIPSESRSEIESLSRTALRLDPHLVAARAMLASLALQFDWDWKGAEQEYREALAAGPNPTVSVQYAMLLCFEGRFAEADQQLRNAQDQDPVGNSTLYQTALVRLLEGRFAESREVSQRLAVIAPASLVPASMIASAYLDEHKPDLAAPYAQKAIGSQAISTMKAELEVRYGHRDEALRIVRSYEDQYPNAKVHRSGVAIVYAALNDEPNTIKWLNRAADDHEMSALNAGVLPVYKPMRKSDGFQAFLRRIRLEAN